MDFLYVISSDRLDEGCFERFSCCLKSLSAQTIAVDIRACIADYSTTSVLPRLDIPQDLNVDYFHRPLETPFNKPFCINYGYKHFECRRNNLFFFSDIDLVYPEQYAERLVNKYGTLSEMLCVTGLQFYQQPKQQLYSADYTEVRNTIQDDIRYEGGCLMISTPLFEKLSGYDESYFGWGGEDDDFFMRAGRAGLFIVDESQEMVHMYHPGDRRKQSANTERLNRRRRSRSDWFKPGVYGEWKHRPIASDRKQAVLETGLAIRAPFCVAMVGPDGTRVRKLTTGIEYELSQPALAMWLLADGKLGRDGVIDVYRAQFGLSLEQATEQANFHLDAMESYGLLLIEAYDEGRELVQVDIMNREDLPSGQLNLILWILSHHFDIVLTPGAHWDADITIFYDNGSTPVPKGITNSRGMSIVWTHNYKYPVREFPDFDLVLSNSLISQEHRQKAMRIPAWMSSFSWEPKANSDSSLPVGVLTGKQISRAKTIEAISLSRGHSDPLTTPPLIELFGQVENIDAYGTDLTPAQRLEIYKSCQFVLIEESVPSGGVSEDLVLAILGGAIPVYRGDPVANFEINSKRFLHLLAGNESEMRIKLAKIKDNPESIESMLQEPLFYNKVLPPTLLPKYVATEMHRVWEKLKDR